MQYKSIKLEQLFVIEFMHNTSPLDILHYFVYENHHYWNRKVIVHAV